MAFLCRNFDYGVDAVSYTHLDVYKRQIPEKTETGEEEDTIILSADKNSFGMEIKKINENYDLTKDYYKNYDLSLIHI